MANIILARGGEPDFKGWFCRGQWAEYGPPYDAQHADDTPPFDSHADGAFGQGYLNLQFPLVPKLAGNNAHAWMRNALQNVKAANDIIFTNWLPTRSYLDAFYCEVTRTDAALTGVYLTPVMYRMAYNFSTGQYGYTQISAFTNDVNAAGGASFKMPLGTPDSGEKLYVIVRPSNYTLTTTDDEALITATYNSTGPSVDTTADDFLQTAKLAVNVPYSFSHNIVTRNSSGEPTGGFDDYFGTTLLGFKVTGTSSKIPNIWKSDFAVYLSAKLLAFEGSSQIG